MTTHATYDLRVQYEDTDFSGYVYHANYIKYCERARSDFTRVRGVNQNALFDGPDKIAFVIRRMICDFLKPARFGDDLTVHTEFKELQGVRMLAYQQVKRGEVVLFTADVTAVLVDGKGRPKRVPLEMVKALLG